jgi:hypothetical protein
MSNEHQQRTTTDELLRNFVAAASVLVLVTLASFIVMGLWK